VNDDEFDPARFARAFERFLDRFHDALPARSNTLRRLVIEHLGRDPSELPTFTERFRVSDQANLQLAFDAYLADVAGWRLLGLPGELRHYGQFSLASILGGRFHGPTEPSAPEFVNVPIDVDVTLPCVRLGVYLLTFEGAPVVAMVGFSEDHGPRPGLLVEVVASDADRAARFVARLRDLMHEHNVFRGKVLSFSFTEWGDFGVNFHRLPAIGRDDIVLAAGALEAIEQHTLGVSRHVDALRTAGRHLKRGLLLFGPPGTGKTLSVMYLCGQMPGRTTLLLSGPSAGALGQAAAIARSLQPAMIVLEDVDLVAAERTMPGAGTNPLLFQLLNEMDGLAEDSDVVFVLTTNRVDLLEPALAARPGRIDQAVEIRLPDAGCRRRLLELYLRGIDHDEEQLDDIVARTDGVTAAFIKELIRRAVLDAANRRTGRTAGGVRLTGDNLQTALVDLVEHSAPVLRSALGANPHIAEYAEFDAMPDIAPGTVGGWVAFADSTQLSAYEDESEL
jgi:ATPase family associated with various cellular activities (AAA)